MMCRNEMTEPQLTEPRAPWFHLSFGNLSCTLNVPSSQCAIAGSIKYRGPEGN